MPITCPVCQSETVQRSRRKGWVDDVLRFAGQWPYRCHTCKLRFRLPIRGVPPEIGSETSEEAAVENEAAALSVRSSLMIPTAQVVIAAKSQQQLEHILSVLAQTVAECDPHARSVGDELSS